MRNRAHHRVAGILAGLGVVALVTAGCGGNDDSRPVAATSADVADASASQGPSSAGVAEKSATQSSPTRTAPSESSPSESSTGSSEVTVEGVGGHPVSMAGPIAVRYSTATAREKKILGRPLTGDRNAGTRDSGVVFQQFQGGVITARNANTGTPAYLTWGKIRDAWNVERDAAGKPVTVGTNGSAGPLGAATSDVKVVRDVQRATFEHGEVEYNTATDTMTVTVNGKKVPAGL